MITTLDFDKMWFWNCLENREKPIIKEQTEWVPLNLILLVSKQMKGHYALLLFRAVKCGFL